MKTALAFLLLLIPAYAASSDEVAATVKNWRASLLKGDAAALGKFYHDDLTYEHSSGKIENKAQAIESVTKPGTLYKAVEIMDPSIRVYGNTAVVKTKADFTNAAGATTKTDLLMVWVKGGAGWQLVARQATKRAE